MRISVELVPREKASLLKELEFITKELREVDTINIPDLLRFQMRSWEGCSLVKTKGMKGIPHLRAIDFDAKTSLPIAAYLQELGTSEILVISGDPPQDMSKKIYPTSSVVLIKKIKQELPGIKAYAAIDPYRTNIKKELQLVDQKLEAGADGFFTQPFFDRRLLEIYAEKLTNTQVFWGVTAVLTARSANYWETRNNVVFPRGFQPTLAWNINFAKEVLALVRQQKSNIYLMPIKTDAELYLKGVFGKNG